MTSEANARRRKLAKERRHSKEKMKQYINDVMPRRTLRASSRKSKRAAEEQRKTIRPWVSEPTYRYKQMLVRSASLLGIPCELRHKILEQTLPGWEFRPNKRFVKSTLRGLHAWVGTLSCVSPLLRQDMVIIKEERLKAFTEGLPEWLQPKKHTEAPQHLKVAKSLSWRGMTKVERRKHESEQKAKIERQRRYRPMKCWHCEERHMPSDSVCPPARRDLAKWLSITRPTKRRPEDWTWKGIRAPFRGKKIVFDN